MLNCKKMVSFVRLSTIRKSSYLSAAKLSGPWNYLDGRRCEPQSSGKQESIAVLYPASGEELFQMTSSGSAAVSAATSSAAAAFVKWSQTSVQERGMLLIEASKLLRERRESVAYHETLDTGKPQWEALMDTDGCADLLEYYGSVIRAWHGEHLTFPNNSFGYTRREPLGVVGAIGAWNFPLQIATVKSAPALACGNTFVLKPSPLTPITALMLAEIYTEVGVPPGVFNVVQGGADTGRLLSSDPRVAKMTLTGSFLAGRSVMEACAQDVKQVSLELGGKSPLIIFDDADVPEAVKCAMLANFMSQGQVCSNGTRVYVHERLLPEFLSLLTSQTARLSPGDPLRAETLTGALISEAQRQRVLGYVQRAQQQGARVAVGGEPVTVPELPNGFFFSPCVLTDVTDDMEVAQEEVFGPVLSLLSFRDESDVVQRANDSSYGLAAGLFTRDVRRAHRVASQLQAGVVYVNNYNVYPPELPFGGYKRSGFGREFGFVALNYYSQVKSVYVEGGDVWSPFH